MESTEMQPYDGIDYRYTSGDANSEKAIHIINKLLGFVPQSEEVHYELSFYSGGIGVDDRLAIRCKVTPEDWSLVVRKLNLKSPLEALSNPEWGEDFAWLVSDEETPSDISKDCCDFINTKKKAFQDVVSSDHTFLFSDESNVNTWCVVWVVGDKLNYLAFDQG